MKIKITCRPRYNLWLKKYLNTKTFSKMLALGVLINSMPINSLAGTLSDDGRYETFEGNNITIDNILEEDNIDVEIEGNTMVNLVEYNNISVSYDEHKNYQILNIEPNQLYTIVIDITSNTVDNGVWFSAYEFAGKLEGSNYYLPESIKGDTKIASNGQVGRFVLKCGFSQRGSLDISRFVLFSKDSTSGGFTANAMVFKGDLDESELPNEYFEGMKSVGQDNENDAKVEVISNNKNLLPYNNVSIPAKSVIAWYDVKGKIGIFNPDVENKTDTWIYLEEGYYKISGDFINCFHQVINTNEEIIDFSGNKLIPSGKYCVRLKNLDTINDFGYNNAYIYKSPIPINSSEDYIPHQSNKIEIPLSEPLRGLPNGVKDKIIKRNGQWVVERNVEQIILNGDENWYIDMGRNNSSTNYFRTHDFVIENKNFSDEYNRKIDFYSNDKYIQNTAQNNWYLIDSEKPNLDVNKSKVVSIREEKLTLEEFKNKLKNNPVTVVYQLINPYYEPLNINSIINTYLDTTHISTNSTIPANLKVTVDRTINRATEAVELAKINPTRENLSLARMWTNLLRESILKDELQSELNNNINATDLQLERKTASSNVDVYIKSENMLMMNLSTNSITFEDFSGVEDMTKENAVNISINSSLPYNLNAYLATEIQNSDKSTTMNKDILSIKDNSELDYQTFSSTNNKITLKSNCNSGNDKQHDINLKLNGGITHEKDVYKATIKFEAEQQ